MRVVCGQADNGGGDLLHAAVEGHHGLPLLVALVQVRAGVQVVVDDVTVLQTSLIGAGHGLPAGQRGRTHDLGLAQGGGEHLLSPVWINEVNYW